MFINNINPVLLSIGSLQIRYYGIIYALGFVIGYLFMHYQVKHGKLHLTGEKLDSYFLWLIIWILIGARLFEILFFSPGYYFSNPSEMILVWHGGLSFHGGLVAAIIFTYLFTKKHKLSFYDIADLLVIPTALGLAFGRIANFINSEHYGKVVDATPWCVVYQKIDGYCRHPSQLYESLKNFLIFGVLMIYNSKRSKSYKKGTLFWMFVLLYGILRIITNFFREDTVYFGLSTGQWFSALMIVVAVVFLYKIKNNRI
ncbi:TPA: prolipoprotein diacylglyceryl transferase [Candidatus Woesearchaeota archaeon]|nr:prolipoprotein diacylglyceryl transferase [Candidatus Woesearchaeota archaeon]HIH31253.1 prolipoprotein diacylglyceryl transferase [Candidatus Woesearchaeota archaeon]HIH54864.1 prolipoprotein diacylglyceryl transferase [Candidatus Woesearchaeota archaeon]HIJ01769.1 prolipoprotein diacylglyceryl transferase [Candidatus Woesearchaeota archaeon]HIJ13532.1 prolipoprotein diacylglyceryl transferase [Candidatus Woesearchaeota archaeon]